MNINNIYTAILELVKGYLVSQELLDNLVLFTLSNEQYMGYIVSPMAVIKQTIENTYIVEGFIHKNIEIGTNKLSSFDLLNITYAKDENDFSGEISTENKLDTSNLSEITRGTLVSVGFKANLVLKDIHNTKLIKEITTTNLKEKIC